MKSNQLNLLLFFLTVMVVYPFGAGIASTNAGRPNDFSISYQYNTGSVPPPYYYEFSITVSPSGQGEIQLVPDHAGDGVPQWIETFELDGPALDQFYSLLVSQGAFTENWQTASPPRLGAPFESVQIVAQGQQLEIPPQVDGSQNRSKDTLTKAIKALVPDSIWSSLKSRHADYSEARYPDGAQ